MATAFKDIAPAFSAADWAAELLERGYCIIPNVMPRTKVAALSADLDERFGATPFCDGVFYGDRTKRFGGLLKRSEHAVDFVAHPFILDIVERVLGPFASNIQLNLTQALELHPGALQQTPHRDQDMWRGDNEAVEYLVNVMWPMTPYTRDNGATIVWPNSHHCQSTQFLPPADAITAEMSPGSALLFLGSTLHGAGPNRSQSVRRGMVISYCLGWLKPYENQWLVYPPEVARGFDPDVAALVGYRQHEPNLGNYEGQCPSVLLRDAVPEHLGAIDHLRPDQAQLMRDFRDGKVGR